MSLSNSGNLHDPSSERAYDIESERLILRIFNPSEPKDYDAVLKMYNDPVNVEYNGDFGLRTHDDLEARRLKMMVLPETCKASDLPAPIAPWWLVYLKVHTSKEDPQFADEPACKQGDFVGIAAMCQRSPAHPPDVGYAILSPYQRKGYALEASLALMDFWRTKMHITEFFIGCFKDNTVSQRVAAKLGFEFGSSTLLKMPSGNERELATWVLPGMNKDFMSSFNQNMLPRKGVGT